MSCFISRFTAYKINFKQDAHALGNDLYLTAGSSELDQTRAWPYGTHFKKKVFNISRLRDLYKFSYLRHVPLYLFKVDSNPSIWTRILQAPINFKMAVLNFDTINEMSLGWKLVGVPLFVVDSELEVLMMWRFQIAFKAQYEDLGSFSHLLNIVWDLFVLWHCIWGFSLFQKKILPSSWFEVKNLSFLSCQSET